jgi:TfoX/Sxy family transcriptional regulator of competence genes
LTDRPRIASIHTQGSKENSLTNKEELRPLQQALEAAMPYPPEAVDLTFRSMFGGIGAYVRGRYFVSISAIGLALKLPADLQDQLLDEEPEAKRLQYSPEAPVSKQYILVPPHFLNNHSLLEPWVKKSIDYAVTLPLKKKKK